MVRWNLYNPQLKIYCQLSFMRILKYIQHTIWMSRRKTFSAIQEGQVLCNGNRIENSKHEVHDGDVLKVLGAEYVVSWVHAPSTTTEQTVLLFHKPVGYVVSKDDPHNDTIYQILPKELSWYYYVGRLDKMSDWLLLLTDSSELVNKLQHPSFGREKHYVVTIDRPWKQSHTPRALAWLVVDGNGNVSPEKNLPGVDTLKCMKISTPDRDAHTLHIVLKEWRKRHIRRLLKALWYGVLKLTRVSFGQFSLWQIKKWEYDIITHNFLAENTNDAT